MLTAVHSFHPTTTCPPCREPGCFLPARLHARTLDLEGFWHCLARWSQQTFGSDAERGPVGPGLHLYKECDEIILKPFDLEEYVDAQHLIFDTIRRAGFTWETSEMGLLVWPQIIGTYGIHTMVRNLKHEVEVLKTRLYDKLTYHSVQAQLFACIRRAGYNQPDFLVACCNKLLVNMDRKWGERSADKPTEHVR